MIGSGEEAEAQRAMDRAKALAEGRPVDDRPRRKATRKAASVAKKVTGVGAARVAPQAAPIESPADAAVTAAPVETAGAPSAVTESPVDAAVTAAPVETLDAPPVVAEAPIDAPITAPPVDTPIVEEQVLPDEDDKGGDA